MAVDVLWRQVEGSLVLQVQQCNASLYIKPSLTNCVATSSVVML